MCAVLKLWVKTHPLSIPLSFPRKGEAPVETRNYGVGKGRVRVGRFTPRSKKEREEKEISRRRRENRPLVDEMISDRAGIF
jgi:hypothetical protein